MHQWISDVDMARLRVAGITLISWQISLLGIRVGEASRPGPTWQTLIQGGYGREWHNFCKHKLGTSPFLKVLYGERNVIARRMSQLLVKHKKLQNKLLKLSLKEYDMRIRTLDATHNSLASIRDNWLDDDCRKAYRQMIGLHSWWVALKKALVGAVFV
jgi:hypothetical protein